MFRCLRLQFFSWHGECIRASRTNKPMKPKFESTYALIVRSEEKTRSILETVIYALAILSAVAGIWQFAQTPLRVSAPATEPYNLGVVCEETSVAGS